MSIFTAPSFTFWNRVEPRPRSDQFAPSLGAPVRDPVWFLFRQWQTGEFAGQDTASPAFVTVATTTAAMTGWTSAGASGTLDPFVPIEKQTMAEPFSATDLALSVDIGQTFRDLLPSFVADAEVVYQAFVGAYPLAAPTAGRFDPLDPGTTAFLSVCGGVALDGTGLYVFGKALAVNPTLALPAGVLAEDVANIKLALAALVSWVVAVWGDLADGDPAAWTPQRLEYRFKVQATSPDGTSVAFDVVPDAAGELPWSSFDVSTTAAPPPAPPNTPQSGRLTFVPGHVRFPSMPAPRFWDFEMNDLALPDVKTDARDVTKVLALDFMLIHGADWFVVPVAQATGTLKRIDALVVTDVFGGLTVIDRADTATSAPGPNRWSLFAPSAPAAVGNYFIFPPSAGNAAATGRSLEDVRFARDDAANMAWGIERNAMSHLGQPRPGAERDAAVDAIAPVQPGPSTDTTSPLRYQVETKVPVHWIPLVIAPDAANAGNLQKAVMARPLPLEDGGGFSVVDPVGRILNPAGVPKNAYLIREEEVPRAGLVVDRTIYRSRWIDGTTHLWIARRRRTGSGETASALQFDLALTTKT